MSVRSPNLRKVLGILTDSADTDTWTVPLVFIHLSYDFESICYSLACDRKTAERTEYYFMISADMQLN